MLDIFLNILNLIHWELWRYPPLMALLLLCLPQWTSISFKTRTVSAIICPYHSTRTWHIILFFSFRKISIMQLIYVRNYINFLFHVICSFLLWIPFLKFKYLVPPNKICGPVYLSFLFFPSEKANHLCLLRSGYSTDLKFNEKLFPSKPIPFSLWFTLVKDSIINLIIQNRKKKWSYLKPLFLCQPANKENQRCLSHSSKRFVIIHCNCPLTFTLGRIQGEKQAVCALDKQAHRDLDTYFRKISMTSNSHIFPCIEKH